MAWIKADTEDEQAMFDYLEELRQSGVPNMFGARPYLVDAFLLPEEDAKATLRRWMEFHSDPARQMEGPGLER